MNRNFLPFGFCQRSEGRRPLHMSVLFTIIITPLFLLITIIIIIIIRPRPAFGSEAIYIDSSQSIIIIMKIITIMMF